MPLKKVCDFFYLFFRFPAQAGIFLRKEYDFFWPALKVIARVYRRLVIPRKKFIVIVGSLGKTTTRHALRKLFSLDNIRQSYSNYGSCLAENMIRSPINQKYDVIEVGIDRPGEMQLYDSLLKPDIVVVTSIQSEHHASLKTLEGAREEKAKMVDQLSAEGLAVLNGDDPRVARMAEGTKARVIFYGFQDRNAVRAENVKRAGDGGLTFDVIVAGRKYPMKTKLLGRHQIYSLLAALTCAYGENKDIRSGISQLENVKPVTCRLEYIKHPHGPVIIDDSFKNVLESLEAALEMLKEFKGYRKIAVLGPVEHPPPAGKRKLYERLGALVAESVDHAVLAGGDELHKLKSSIKKHSNGKVTAVKVSLDVRKAYEAVKKLAPFSGTDIIFIKARGADTFRRITLMLGGGHVVCDARVCIAKIESCDRCPLLARKVSQNRNYFIRRAVKTLGDDKNYLTKNG